MFSYDIPKIYVQNVGPYGYAASDFQGDSRQSLWFINKLMQEYPVVSALFVVAFIVFLIYLYRNMDKVLRWLFK